MVRPYIGITDFTNYKQVLAMSSIFGTHRSPGSSRVLHVGVLMSYKTLRGITSEWQHVFPPKERIASIFSSERVYNCIHFVDYENGPDLWKNMAAAYSYGGAGIHALQLDMVWPSPAEIAHGIRAIGDDIEIILQIGQDALDGERNDPARVVARLAHYEGVIQRVLLDRSMGRGHCMEAKRLLPFVRAIRSNFPTLGIGVAGGLGPDTIHLVKPLVDEFPDLSIDAQGRLRPSGDALDPIDWTMAGNYLIQALNVLN